MISQTRKRVQVSTARLAISAKQQIAVMMNKEDLVRGERFSMRYYEPGTFSLIYGLFGYDTVEGANMFGEEGEIEPPKSLDSNPFLFQPPVEE